MEGAPSLNYLGIKMSPDRAEVMSERAGALSYIVCIVLLQLTLANAFDWPERIVGREQNYRINVLSDGMAGDRGCQLQIFEVNIVEHRESS